MRIVRTMYCCFSSRLSCVAPSLYGRCFVSLFSRHFNATLFCEANILTVIYQEALPSPSMEMVSPRNVGSGMYRHFIMSFVLARISRISRIVSPT